MSTGSNSGGGGGRRPFFNDRRFTMAGPQRLRQNVQDLLSSFNRQFATDNPNLLHDLADQLNRLQDLLGTNPNGQQQQAAAPAVQLPPHQQPPDTMMVDDGESAEPREFALDMIDIADSLGAVHDSRQRIREFHPNGQGETSGSGQAQQGDGRSGAGQNESVVLNMDIGFDGSVRMAAGVVPTADADPPEQQPVPTNNNGQQQQQHGPNAEVEMQRLVAAIRAPEMQRIIRIGLNFGPFLFILLTKWMLTYAAGIVTMIFLTATFFYSENVIETVVAASRTQQMLRLRVRLLSTIILLTTNIVLFYLWFAKDELYLSLLFQPTVPLLEDDARHLTLLTVFWLIITADFVAKFLFMTAKCLVLSGPTLIAAHRRKAQAYQWLEYTCHMYRHWLPALPWSYYLTATSPSVGYVHNGLCTILFLAYLCLKIKLFRIKLKRWWKSTVALLRPSSFGFSPSTTDLMKIGPTCSICYGEYANPVQLQCKHIFCEECVATWLDKQKTCPMCRTQVITGDNDWKDGKTSYCVQLI